MNSVQNSRPDATTMLPDFLIIGAMKAATSTLHDQLARQPGIFMTTPKEPYFFSDDPVYARGLAWYQSLFEAATPGDIKGESTTHYSKLPTYPKTVERIQRHAPHARFIYVMRHPIDRLVSQYIHQWTEREIAIDINLAVDRYPELIAYSRYSYQLQPYFDAFGPARVLPVFFDRLLNEPQAELTRICRFLGYERTPVWYDDNDRQNASSERMRESKWRDRLAYAPGISQIRQHLVPPAVRERIKALWRMQRRPQLDAERQAQLTALFDQDLARLGSWFGVELTCENFKSVTKAAPLEWQAEAVR